MVSRIKLSNGTLRNYVISFMDQNVVVATIRTPKLMTFRETAIWAVKIMCLQIGGNPVFSDNVIFEISEV